MKFKIFLVLVFFTSLLCAQVEIVESSKDHYLLEVSFTDYNIHQTNHFTIVENQEWSSEAVAGHPDLPLTELKFIVPADGNLQVNLISQQNENIRIDKPLKPVPYYNETSQTYDFIIKDEFYVKKPAIVAKEKQRFRFYNFVPVQFSPVQLTENGILVNKKMLVEVKITGDFQNKQNISDKFSDIYQNMFCNYKHNRFITSKPQSLISYMPFSQADFWYKLKFSSQAIYGLTSELDILPEFVEPQTIRIFGFHKNENGLEVVEVPLQIDENDIIFSTKNLAGNFAWLTFGGRFKQKPFRDEINKVGDFQKLDNFIQIAVEDITKSRDEVNSIIITPQDFADYAEELAALHEQSFNISSLVVQQQSIFNQFGEEPAAIERYLQDKFEQVGGEALESVILLGSGTEDWEVVSSKNRIITYNYRDDNFVSFYGTYPELAISRIPVQNRSDLDLILNRMQSYIQTPNLGLWRNNVLFTADDENKGGGLEGIGDVGMNHTLKCEQTAALIRDYVETTKVYGIEYNFDEYNNKPAARQAIIDKINEGCLMWYYVGHGDEEVLGDEEYFKGSLHLRQLENNEMLNLFMAASCSVGRYDALNYNCLAEKILFQENGGSIASLAASRGSSPTPNTDLFKRFVQYAIIEREKVGFSLWQAKLDSPTNHISNNTLYHLFGNLYLPIIPPEPTGAITGLPDSVFAKQTVSFDGDLSQAQLTGTGVAKVYDSSSWITYTNVIPPDTTEYSVTYLRKGNSIYKANMSVNQGEFEGQFIVPVGIDGGDMGLVSAYYADETNYKDYISYYRPLKLNPQAVEGQSTSAPQIQLWLDSPKFVSGDYVSTNPMLMAHIQDENGINISGAPGRRILALLDESNDPENLLDVTSGFIYNADSYTEGELSWQLNDLSEGKHTLQLLVYDNFGNSSLAEVDFYAQDSEKLTIRDMLVYPNPVKKDGHFTFLVTEDSDIKISVYTITGKKIKTITQVVQKGYNQIYWNGRDADGDRIANNTYFYKIRAKQTENGQTTEKIGKLIISK
jgi:hypothetical protein